MKYTYLNAASASFMLDDISRQFMTFHDDINDLKITESHYDIELLMIKYFGAHLEERHFPLVRAILTSVCESTTTLCSQEDDDFDIEVEQYEFEF